MSALGSIADRGFGLSLLVTCTIKRDRWELATNGAALVARRVQAPSHLPFAAQGLASFFKRRVDVFIMVHHAKPDAPGDVADFPLHALRTELDAIDESSRGIWLYGVPVFTECALDALNALPKEFASTTYRVAPNANGDELLLVGAEWFIDIKANDTFARQGDAAWPRVWPGFAPSTKDCARCERNGLRFAPDPCIIHNATSDHVRGLS